MTIHDEGSPPHPPRGQPNNNPGSGPAQSLPEWLSSPATPSTTATPPRPLDPGVGGAGALPPAGGAYPPGDHAPNFYRGLAVALFLSAVFLFVLAIVGAVGYVVVASDLPAPDELRSRAANFASTRIYDRTGKELNEVFDPDEGRRTPVKLDV